MTHNTLTEILEKIECYTCNSRYKLIRHLPAENKGEKVLRLLFSWKGFIALWLLGMVLLFWWVSYEIADFWAQFVRESWRFRFILFFIFTLLSTGFTILFQAIIGLLGKEFTAKKLLREGFTYLQKDSRDFLVLQRFLASKALPDLQCAHIFFANSPPFSVFAMPLKKAVAWVFSFFATTTAVFTFLLKAGESQSLLKQLESMIMASKMEAFLALEIVVLTFLLVAVYYMTTANWYEQKNKRVIALLALLIDQKQHDESKGQRAKGS
ncbi:hypothetical protein GCM10009007_20510 [Formosimonas limnophila]|uniref:Uncharacterized protein n=1 Tax=Formosimonas limnophila TaxID=1384487 RepID=A0A8J3CP64_9BURK|nr:hypothetical protein [Formosimonas limnophila]GHA79427.1 hypothetical protein GCM10009007_20510 [Formosimonas limnophila]